MTDRPEFAKILEDLRRALASAADAAAVAEARTAFLGRKGTLTAALRKVGGLPAAERKAAGAEGNRTKSAAERLLSEAAARFTGGPRDRPFDVTLPGVPLRSGHLHPVTLVTDQIIGIFSSLGFSLAEGPEVEDDWHNFEALNIPADHPGRDMQDTFYLAGSQDRRGDYQLLPRTHTSGVQIRTMRKQRPPIRIVAPGKVYRNETEDATHSAVFDQVEGLMVDRDTSFTDLKGILTLMVQRLLGEESQLRFRPSFFPFTEPSAEIDVSMPTVRNGKWLELAGAGMVHPTVLKNAGYDPKRVQGFAFGLGIERVAMLKYGIDDLRPFFRPDLRLLEQF